MSNVDLIEWWLHQFKFTEQDMNLLQSYETDFIITNKDYDIVREKALSMLPVRSIDYNIQPNYYISLVDSEQLV